MSDIKIGYIVVAEDFSRLSDLNFLSIRRDASIYDLKETIKLQLSFDKPVGSFSLWVAQPDPDGPNDSEDDAFLEKLRRWKEAGLTTMLDKPSSESLVSSVKWKEVPLARTCVVAQLPVKGAFMSLAI